MRQFGRHSVDANLTVFNAGSSPADFPFSDLYQGAMLRDGQGRTFSLDSTASIFASPDGGSDLQPGLTYRITLVFDAPAGARGFIMLIDDREIPLDVRPASQVHRAASVRG